VSLGGRIVLLNAVLNAIPIFYLSFMKIPVLVWKKFDASRGSFFGAVEAIRRGLVGSNGM
jgi:hypothetical protein